MGSGNVGIGLVFYSEIIAIGNNVSSHSKIKVAMFSVGPKEQEKDLISVLARNTTSTKAMMMSKTSRYSARWRRRCRC